MKERKEVLFVGNNLPIGWTLANILRQEARMVILPHKQAEEFLAKEGGRLTHAIVAEADEATGEQTCNLLQQRTRVKILRLGFASCPAEDYLQMPFSLAKLLVWLNKVE